MYIKGIGKVAKAEILSVLASDAKKNIRLGLLTWGEAAAMYKFCQVRKLSTIGSFQDAFYQNFNRIPLDLFDRLSPADLAVLVDAFYKCYGDGMARKKDG